MWKIEKKGLTRVLKEKKKKKKMAEHEVYNQSAACASFLYGSLDFNAKNNSLGERKVHFQ